MVLHIAQLIEAHFSYGFQNGLTILEHDHNVSVRIACRNDPGVMLSNEMIKTANHFHSLYRLTTSDLTHRY